MGQRRCSTDGLSSWVLTSLRVSLFSSTKWGESCLSPRVTVRVKEKDYKALGTCYACSKDLVNVVYPCITLVAKYLMKSTCLPCTSQDRGELNGDCG